MGGSREFPRAAETEGSAAGRASAIRDIPSDALIVVPVRNFVLFPSVVFPISVGRPASVAAVQEAVRRQAQIGILMQRDPEQSEPLPVDLYRIGTVANIVRYVTAPDGGHHLVCQGEARFRVAEFLSGWSFPVAQVVRLPEYDTRSPQIEARFLLLRQRALEAVRLLPQAPQELADAIEAIKSPATLADVTVAYMDAKPEEKQEILETIDLEARGEGLAPARSADRGATALA